jgi:parallel beta-helix repeat protein
MTRRRRWLGPALILLITAVWAVLITTGSISGAAAWFLFPLVLPEFAAWRARIRAGRGSPRRGEHLPVHAQRYTSCRRNEIRDNTIIVRRVRFASSWVGIRIAEAGDSTVVGVPLHLVNFPAVEPETYGDPEEAAPAVIEDNLIEGNRVLGAEGIGIELVHASRNRLVGNTITHIEARASFPGTALLYPVLWRDANGAGIWVSPGSEENEIAGNIFEDIANAAVVIEGDRNRVETRGAAMRCAIWGGTTG